MIYTEITAGVWLRCVHGDHPCGPGTKMHAVGDGLLLCDQHVECWWRNDDKAEK